MHVGELIRRHWLVESMHWALDVIFHEDETRIRNQLLLLNLNILRKLALALHKQYIKRLITASEKKKKRYSLTGSMKKCLLSDEYLLEVIAAPLLKKERRALKKANKAPFRGTMAFFAPRGQPLLICYNS